jgi:hypothetical protein
MKKLASLFRSLLVLASLAAFLHPSLGIAKSSLKSPKSYPFGFYKVRSHEELMKLSRIGRAIYLSEIRDAVIEMSEQLESADGSEAAVMKKRLDAFAFLFGADEAFADEARKCANAGWILNYEGRYCAKPPKSESCKSSEVQCNPLLFGEGHCAPVGTTKAARSVTAHCMRNKAYDSDILKYAEAHADQWNELKQNVDSFCPSEKQAAVCRMIQSRLAAVEPKASGEPAKAEPATVLAEAVPAAKAAATDGAPAAVTAVPVRGRPAAAITESVAVDSRPAPKTVPPEIEVDPSQKEMGPQNKGPRKCIWSMLMWSFMADRNIGPPVLPYADARYLACGNNSISDKLIKQVRERAAKAKKSAETAEGIDRSVARDWNDRVIRNFEVCSAVANARKPGDVVQDFKPDVELVFSSSDYTQGAGYEGIMGSNEPELGQTLAARGIHLCRTKLTNPRSIAPELRPNAVK